VSDGELVLPDGAIVTGSKVDGVRISGDGKFTMTGGEISGSGNNKGNGVFMTGGEFVMTGGEIARNGFKGVKIGSGVFIKTGGTVYGTQQVAGNNRNGEGSINNKRETYGPEKNYP
jgi:hypothetical protein